MHTTLRSPVLAMAFVVALAGTALATPATGLSATPLARGTLSQSQHVNTGEVKFRTKGPVDVVTQTITFSAPSSSGWHAHPGVVLVAVKSGSLVHYDADCSATVYPAGSAFADSGSEAGLVRNESTTTPAVVYATFLVPAGTTALRLDRPNPGCPEA